MGAVVKSIHLEYRQSANELQHAKAQLAAEAGLAMAIQALSTSPASMVADGRPYVLPFEDAQLTLQVYSERGKLDLNFANTESFTRLASKLGASSDQTRQLAAQLNTRRADGLTLKALEELQQFKGMDPSLYERLAPYLTLWTGLGQPDPSFASDTVRTALRLGPIVPGRNPGTTLNAHIRAELATVASTNLNVTFILNPQGDGTQLYRVLRWQE